MVLATEVKYETKIRGCRECNPLSPESVIDMLKDVKENLGKLDSSFADFDLKEVLAVVEKGKHVIKGDVETRINLSDAAGIISSYRHYSEGGCKSCLNLGKEHTDPGSTDPDFGYYCKISDPAYDSFSGCKVNGFSSIVSQYYNNPCEDWKPRFPKTLDKVIAEAE